MPVNPALQARAGRNSPEQSLAPEFSHLLGIVKVLTAALAPGVNIKIAEGGDGLLSPVGLRAFIGLNAGAAALTITLTVQRDSDGAVFQTEVLNLAAPFGDDTVGSAIAFLPKGFSLWANVTLTAGVYGGDAELQYGLAQTKLVPEGPVDLTTSVETVITVDEGHTKLLGLNPLLVFNRDTAVHDFEVTLSRASGDTIIGVGTVIAGSVGNLLGFGLVLNSGESLKVRMLPAIVTPGRSVTVMGLCNESNLLNV